MDGLDDAPDPADPALEPLEPAAWSVDELELEDDGALADGALEDGALEDGEDGAGVDGAGVDGVALLELEEPDGELGFDGDVMPPEALPDELPVPDVLRSAPRSQAAIRLAPSARDTATARV